MWREFLSHVSGVQLVTCSALISFPVPNGSHGMCGVVGTHGWCAERLSSVGTPPAREKQCCVSVVCSNAEERAGERDLLCILLIAQCVTITSVLWLIPCLSGWQ